MKNVSMRGRNDETSVAGKLLKARGFARVDGGLFIRPGIAGELILRRVASGGGTADVAQTTTPPEFSRMVRGSLPDADEKMNDSRDD